MQENYDKLKNFYTTLVNEYNKLKENDKNVKQDYNKLMDDYNKVAVDKYKSDYTNILINDENAKLKKERGYEYVGETKHKCNVRSDF